ncbi:hypothetical protein Q6348_09460 [Isoptericola sp. b441]|uniref:Cell division protein FtsL n=1 Tax=Actinotalea lenta TaxID=3064654 RepID=A0ABT9D942_9CELL|nr:MULTISPECIES: hypothetical protein [unclassified Isoptericola]MDO8107422.1 hypothetical protein [Isoptericola sp. b441]MDO8120916.1 hypothetical protein [Isoptericola sp. b490]
MSAAQSAAVRAPARPVPRPAPAPPRPRLRVVPAPHRARTRVPFVVLCMVVLAASLLGVLLLNTAMAQGEYERYGLATRLAQAAQRQQELVTQLDQAAAPAELARRAQALGMVPSTTGGYLRLSDGAVLGTPTPAGRG